MVNIWVMWSLPSDMSFGEVELAPFVWPFNLVVPKEGYTSKKELHSKLQTTNNCSYLYSVFSTNSESTFPQLCAFLLLLVILN